MQEIGVVMYDGAQLAAILGLTDLFAVANRVAAEQGAVPRSAIRVTHWQQQPLDQPPQCIFSSHACTAQTRLTALVLPPALGEPAQAAAMSSVITWLQAQHAEGVVLTSVCAGAFLLAATGLMSGRRMTTHWSHAELLHQRFPDVVVDTDQLLIDDADVITAGGLMAWTDLGLRLVDRLLGPTVMMATARLLLVDPAGREQRFYSVFSPSLSHGDAAILKVQHWLQATQAREISLASLAAEAGLEERTLLRRFQKATGMTTTEYCQHLRVGKARELLQFSNASIDSIAWDVGYRDPSAFRKVFTRIVGLAPSEYRRRFNAG